MWYTKDTSDLPDFIVRSTFGVALASVFILTPYTVNNFIQGRYVLGILTLLVLFLCTINAWYCHKGRYLLAINLFGIAPAIGSAIIIATYKLGVPGSYWAFLAVLAFYVILSGNWALIANIVFAAIIIPLAWSVLEGPAANRFTAVLIGTSIFAYLLMSEITKQHYLLKQRAVVDSLTGLHNRSLLQEKLDQAIEQGHSTGAAMTLIMIDVDFFKTINDRFGHDVGDSVLTAMGGLLRESFRQTDTVFRIGGEEFLVIFPDTDEYTCLQIANKICKKIEQLSLIPDHTVTVSIGIAGLQPDMKSSGWLKLCDEKLYLAKSNGRNQAFL